MHQNPARYGRQPHAVVLLVFNYTSPFTGQRGADNPVVFAGFVVRNSETGDGSFSITPQLTAQVCRSRQRPRSPAASPDLGSVPLQSGEVRDYTTADRLIMTDEVQPATKVRRLPKETTVCRRLANLLEWQSPPPIG